MKRRILSLTMAAVMCLAMALLVYAAPADEVLVYDEASLLSESEAAQLNTRLQNLSATYAAQIVIATVESVEGADIDEFINLTYDEMGFGYGDSHDGVLLLIGMDLREYRILTNGKANEAIGESEIEMIGDRIVSDLSDGNYADAFQTFADECEYYLNGYVNGFPFDAGATLMVAVVIGLVAGVVTALILKGQLKSVRQQHQANVYVKAGSMHLSTSNDLFLYRTVERRKKESSSSGSSGSSGSSRSVGGGKF